MILSVPFFKDVIKTLEGNDIRKCQDILESKYPMVPPVTLGSIFANHVQKKMRLTHGQYATEERVEQFYNRFLIAVCVGERSGIILRLSDEIRITPVLTARFILEGYLRALQKQIERTQKEDAGEGDGCEPMDRHDVEEKTKYNFGNLRSEITRLLRNTNLIDDKRLAFEVHLCLVHDENYGPSPDIIKRCIGEEYEVKLMKDLDQLGITYMDEKKLRMRGFDKTPDIKLDVPIAVDENVVNWIESKATFGDEETHLGYLTEQLSSYLNRFGPGMVIYWLGHVDTLRWRTPEGIIVRTEMPKNSSIVRMDPSLIQEDPEARNQQRSGDNNRRRQ